MNRIRNEIKSGWNEVRWIGFFSLYLLPTTSVAILLAYVIDGKLSSPPSLMQIVLITLACLISLYFAGKINMRKLTDRSVKYFDGFMSEFFLSFLVGKAQAREILELRPKLRDRRWLIDSKIKSTCFFVSSLVFMPLFIGIFLYKREQWFVNVFGTLRIYPTIAFGVLAGLIAGLLIGVGLIASLLISYAHSIEAKLIFLKEYPTPPVVGLNENERDDRWREYNLHIDLYKYYLELGLKANLFFYLITGTILGFYLTHPDVRYKKVSLLLPILMSLALGGMFIHAAMLWIRIDRIIRGIRRELNIKKAPDINIMTVLLVVFGFITLIVGVSMVLLVIVT